MFALQNLMDYYEQYNIDVFEGCTTPEPINNELLKSYIMRRCGLLQPIYAEPHLFKMQVKMWYDSNQWRMDHLVKMLLADYEPHENVFEYEHWKEAHSGTDLNGGADTLTHGETHTLSGDDTLTHGETHTLSGTDTDTDSTSNEHSVSAYNANTYQPDSKDQKGGTISTQYGKTDTASGDDKTTYGKIDTASGDDKTTYGKVDTASGDDKTTYGKVDTASGDDKTTYGKVDTASGDDVTAYGKTFTHGEIIEYEKNRHGNVGVKSSSDLMQEELDLLERFNVYDTIAKWFENELMIEVY